jgi:hypothetical protein
VARAVAPANAGKSGVATKVVPKEAANKKVAKKAPMRRAAMAAVRKVVKNVPPNAAVRKVVKKLPPNVAKESAAQRTENIEKAQQAVTEIGVPTTEGPSVELASVPEVSKSNG